MKWFSFVVVIFSMGSMPSAAALADLISQNHRVLDDIDGWAIEQTYYPDFDQATCRATKTVTNKTLELVSGSPISSDCCKLSMYITIDDFQLPSHYSGKVELISPGKPSLVGELDDVGTWVGGHRTDYNARATFKDIESSKFDLLIGDSFTLKSENDISAPIEIRENFLGIWGKLKECRKSDHVL